LRIIKSNDRRQLLKQLLGRRKSLVYNREIIGRGPEVYRAACRMGLEGIVSKQVTAPYRSGRTKTWLKVKNPGAPAALRFSENVE
jgi:bifunctional non-homologous end joining protein LigD